MVPIKWLDQEAPKRLTNIKTFDKVTCSYSRVPIEWLDQENPNKLTNINTFDKVMCSHSKSCCG